MQVRSNFCIYKINRDGGKPLYILQLTWIFFLQSLHPVPPHIRTASSSLFWFSNPTSKMSHQGRCTAIILAITLLITLYSLSSVSARPTIHTVGDDSGWTYNVERWTRGKRFQAGDTLGNLGKPTIFRTWLD